jgi:Probable cobalt transporter subunit (CbtB)
MEVTPMDTPANPAVPDAAGVVADPADIAAGTARLPSWLIVGIVAAAAIVLWLVAFDNGQASAMADSTGTALHELFHDGRHLMGAPCH